VDEEKEVGEDEEEAEVELEFRDQADIGNSIMN